MKKPTLAIQLYTLRDHIQTAEDFDETLKRLSSLGVKDVQISGIGDIPAEEQKAILNRYDMNVCVTHKGYDMFVNDAEGLVEHHRIIGCDAIGLGAAPGEKRDSLTAVREFISEMQRAGKIFKENGMNFHYHNHDFEFKKLEDCDCRMIDLLISETDPELFSFIPDVAWIDYAGSDPVEIMKKLKGRVKVLHFKDYIIDSEGNLKFVSLGKGVVDLKKCYEAACELEIPYIAYEQDRDWVDNDPFKATEESWAFMKSLEK